MQLKIEFTEAYGPIGDGVSFHALVDGAQVVCIITGGALEALDPERWLDDPIAQFTQNRARIQDVAHALINAGRVDDRTLMINSADLNHSGSAL